MGDANKHLLNCSENLKLRNAVTREERLPLLSVSGVSQRWSQYFRVAVSRVAGFQMHSFPRSGAEAQNTLALRKSSIFVNPHPGIYNMCPLDRFPCLWDRDDSPLSFA